VLSDLGLGVGFPPGFDAGADGFDVSDSLGGEDVIEVFGVRREVVRHDAREILVHRLESSLDRPALGLVVELVGEFELDLMHGASLPVRRLSPLLWGFGFKAVSKTALSLKEMEITYAVVKT